MFVEIINIFFSFFIYYLTCRVYVFVCMSRLLSVYLSIDMEITMHNQLLPFYYNVKSKDTQWFGILYIDRYTLNSTRSGLFHFIYSIKPVINMFFFLLRIIWICNTTCHFFVVGFFFYVLKTCMVLDVL